MSRNALQNSQPGNYYWYFSVSLHMGYRQRDQVNACSNSNWPHLCPFANACCRLNPCPPPEIKIYSRPLILIYWEMFYAWEPKQPFMTCSQCTIHSRLRPVRISAETTRKLICQNDTGPNEYQINSIGPLEVIRKICDKNGRDGQPVVRLVMTVIRFGWPTGRPGGHAVQYLLCVVSRQLPCINWFTIPQNKLIFT